MLFTSPEFFVLVALTFPIYYLCRSQRLQVLVLVVASVVFYAWSSPYLLFLLLGSSVINGLIAHLVLFSGLDKKKALLVGVSINLFILGFFKYGGLLGTTFASGTLEAFLVSVPLPVGISFYTFQGISLVVDSARDDGRYADLYGSSNLASNLEKSLFFLSFFPQLVAGPIVKAHDFLPQVSLKSVKSLEISNIFRVLVMGYFLKTFVADNLNMYTSSLRYPMILKLDTLNHLVYLLGYSMQIFADFAGYSLIAIGIAGLFGYKLPQNFNYPYLSTSFREFWKRWHITLSSFLMEYLYIPMGGNRKGKGRTYLNLIITMVLGGLWHGATWNFAIWGLYHGLLLAVERFVVNELKWRIPLPRGLAMLLVFGFVSMGWLLFIMVDLGNTAVYFSQLVSNLPNRIDFLGSMYVLFYSSVIVLLHAYRYAVEQHRLRLPDRVKFVLYGLMLFLILNGKGLSSSFIYFQF